MKKLNYLTLAMLILSIVTLPAQEKDGAEFKGKIGNTLKDSEEYWPEPVVASEGAPNVLIWLIDDMGYGHSSAFGGLTPMPTIERLSNQGLRFNNFHTTHCALHPEHPSRPDAIITISVWDPIH